MSLLYGVHDREGRHIVPPGGWVVDTVALSENPQPTDYGALRAELNWIVRLNWGYGSTGTIPLANDYQRMAQAAAHYVHNSRGAHRFIVGNEPNHENERPNGVFITPAEYVRCFVLCRDAIKRADPNAQVIPAPCAPYHANPMPWTDYWREMLELIAKSGGCDGLAIHAYTRSSNAADITSMASMGPPLEGTFAGFYTFIDALEEVPDKLSHLPVYITEFNEILDNGWHDANTGVVQEAYQTIHEWNQEPDEQKIQCLCLYRWPRFDKWHIDGKNGVLEDFRAAVAKGYKSPDPSTDVDTFIPTIGTGPTSTLPPRDIDPRAIQRGVSLVEVAPKPGQIVWRVKSIRWLNEQESQGRHHIYVDTLDEQGRRMAGVPLRVMWPTGNTNIVSEAKPGEPYSANYPMSPSRNEFSLTIADGTPAEMVRGIGMGMDTPSGFNAGIHTSTAVVFQRVKGQDKPIDPPTPVKVPALVHPVGDARYRRVTQVFGVNGDYYKQFKVDGVPLKGHNGVDFGTPVGTPIIAVDDGTVVEVHDEGAYGYGKYVKLVHSWGESLYAHLDHQDVPRGAKVIRGVQVGLSGNTGNSTGPHLHFGLRVHPFNRQDGWGGYSDPLPYLQKEHPPQPTVDVLGLIKSIALRNGLDWRLVASLVMAESSFSPRAESKAGAIGLMQLMPATFDEWSERVGASDIWSPEHNLKVGCAYLAWLIRYYKGSEYTALVAYNFGPGNVDSGRTPPPETIAYANKVLFGRDLLKTVGAS